MAVENEKLRAVAAGVGRPRNSIKLKSYGLNDTAASLDARVGESESRVKLAMKKPART